MRPGVPPDMHPERPLFGEWCGLEPEAPLRQLADVRNREAVHRHHHLHEMGALAGLLGIHRSSFRLQGLFDPVEEGVGCQIGGCDSLSNHGHEPFEVSAWHRHTIAHGVTFMSNISRQHPRRGHSDDRSSTNAVQNPSKSDKILPQRTNALLRCSRTKSSQRRISSLDFWIRQRAREAL